MNPAVANGFFLTLKSSVAAALAVMVCQALGVTDLLSASFVAVISASPTLTSGLRRASEQLVLSLLAGASATLWALAPLPLPLPLRIMAAVACAVAMCFPLGLATSFGTAAFCALYVLLIPGAPTGTLLLRLASVAVGCTCAFAVNAVVTGPFYGAVFRRRMLRLRVSLDSALQHAGAPGLWTWEVSARHVLGELDDALAERWHPGVPREELGALRMMLEGWLVQVVKVRATEGDAAQQLATLLRDRLK